MDISAIQQQTTSQATSSAASLSQNFDTFLQLLTTQLQNQDPLDPLDTNEFTSQLVEFTSVEQAIATNKNLESLIAATTASSNRDAVGYLGMEVTVDGRAAELAGGSANWTYELEDNAEVALAVITNSSGAVIHSEPVETSEGSHTYEWNGRAANGQVFPDGSYFLTIEATDTIGAPVGASTTTKGLVTQVDFAGGEPSITVNGSSIPLSNVLSVTTP